MSHAETHAGPNALTRMRRMVQQLEEDASDIAPYQEWLRLVPGDGAELSRNWRDVQLLLARVSALKGWASRVHEVRRILRMHAHVTEAPGEDCDGVLSELLIAEGCPDVPQGLRLPSGYSATGSGISSADGMVSHDLVAVVAKRFDAEDEKAFIETVYQTDRGWRTLTIPKGVAADTRQIIKLADEEFPVDSTTSRAMVCWLRDQAHAAIHLPSVVTMSRTGWLPDMSGFAGGPEWTPSSLTITASGQGEKDKLKGLSQRGNLAGWRNNVWDVVKHHPAGLVVLTAFVPPLLRVLDAQGWTLDIGGLTGSGKSTASRAALSVWGDWRRLEYRWPRTRAGARAGLELWNDFPVVYDDTRILGGEWKLPEELVMQVTQQATVALGDGRGGTRRQRPVSTVLISTGESTIAEHLEGQGALGRLLTMQLSARHPSIPGGAPALDLLREACTSHHGVAGPRFVRWLMANKADWERLVDGYNEEVTRIRSMCDDTAGHRISAYLAQLRCAAFVAEQALGVEVPESLHDYALQLMAESSEARDLARVAHLAIWERAVANPRHWPKLCGDMQPMEWWGEWREEEGVYCWLPNALRTQMRSLGFDLADHMMTWRERGVFEKQSRGWQKTVRVGMTGKQKPMACFVMRDPNVTARQD